MEALILLGVLGTGYLINEDKEKKQKTFDEVKPPLFQGSGNTIYDMNNVKDAQRYEVDQVMKHHEKAMESGSKVIDSLNMGGRNTLKDQKIYDNIIKTLDGNTINKQDFLINDQGIKTEPFISRNGGSSLDLDSRGHRMDSHFGGYHADQSGQNKTTDLQGPLGDAWVKQDNVFGGRYEGQMADHSRYNEGMFRNNENAFEQERVAPIDEKSNINGDINRLYAQKNSVDNRRSLIDQKVLFEGRVLSGKGITDKRGEEGQVFKHLPDQDYVNDADKWLVTMGAVDAARIRPEEDLKYTNRQYLNEGAIGIPGPVIFKGNEERPNFKKTTNQQLFNDTERNISLEGKMNDNDHNKSSYISYPNEREITSERTYEGNFKSVFNAQTENIQDTIRPTIKETTLDTREGFVNQIVTLPEERLQDPVKPTIKSTTNYEHTGNAGTTIPAEMATDKFLRADLNPNKEIISRGRNPTPENTKLANGVDTLKVDIKKIESDYLNPRFNVNNIDKIYQEIPQDYPCEFTQEKDTLNNEKLSNRLDPNLLDPFRMNPYTKSLASFA